MNEQLTLEEAVTQVLLRCGIPPHLNGYRYIRTAIIGTVRDASMMDLVTKRLYPYVAMHHDTTASRVNRGIRTAIDVSWNNGSGKKFFSEMSYSQKNQPSNSEFIALAADRMRLMLKVGKIRFDDGEEFDVK